MKTTGNKTTFKKGITAVGEVTSISPVAITTDAIETTSLDDDFRTYIPGLSDGGEVTVTGHYTGDEAGQDALQAAQAAKTTDAYSIVYPAAIGMTWSFNAFITSFSILDATNDDPIGFEAVLKITGEPTLAATA